MARKIAVVGGGVVGCSIAWHLAEAGAGDVTLFERDTVGSGSTWHSAGNINWKPIGDHDAPVRYMIETVARLTELTGQETGWRCPGRLFLARTDAGLKAFESSAHQARAARVEGEMLSPGEAASRHPLLDAGAIVGAWFNPMCGRVNPADLTAAFSRAARKAGAAIREGVTIGGIEVSGGKVTGLAINGAPMPFDDVVVAAGHWSRELLAAAGQPLAQRGCEHLYLIARPEPGLPRDVPSYVCPEDLIYGREETGGFLIGCFDRDAAVIEDGALPEPFTFALLEPAWDKIAPYYEKACELFPALTEAEIPNFINGPEAFTPDGLPLIGPLADVEGLFVATGMNSYGVTLAAAAGRIVADMLQGQTPTFDAGIYDPGRFGDKVRDEAWLREMASGAPSLGYAKSNLI